MGAVEKLRELSMQGLEHRYGEDIKDQAKERLEYELNIIGALKKADLFLAAADTVNWLKAKGAVLSNGRGTLPESIVAYCLGITNVDPIKYDLIFERFLNPEAANDLQISLYVASDNSAEAMEYIAAKYPEFVDTIVVMEVTDFDYSDIEVLADMIALDRPLPADIMQNYNNGRKNPAEIKYICQQLKPILESTGGVVIYQEQIMQIMHDLAGFSWSQSDELRRKLAKRVFSDQWKKNFIYGNDDLKIVGCLKNGLSEEEAGAVWDLLEKMTRFGFNKSHAIGCAMDICHPSFCILPRAK